MCYNLVIKTFEVNKKQKKEIRNLLKQIFEEFKYNDDGAFLYNSLQNQIIRTLNYDEFQKKLENLKIDNNTLLHMHLRKATSGSVSENNIHGWQIGQYLCSHNGYYGYSYYYTISKKELNDNSDSYEFFSKNAEAINSEDVEAIDVNNFYGVAYCNSLDSKKLLIISKHKTVKLYYLKSLILISNESLDSILSQYYEVGDLKFKMTVPKSEIENKIILLNTDNFKIIKERDIRDWYYYYSYKTKYSDIYDL
jgi:RNA binding exosome subunit